MLYGFPWFGHTSSFGQEPEVSILMKRNQCGQPEVVPSIVKETLILSISEPTVVGTNNWI